MKIGGNLIYEIGNGLSLKLYYDSEPGTARDDTNDGFNVSNVGYFIGYDKKKSKTRRGVRAGRSAFLIFFTHFYTLYKKSKKQNSKKTRVSDDF